MLRFLVKTVFVCAMLWIVVWFAAPFAKNLPRSSYVSLCKALGLGEPPAEPVADESSAVDTSTTASLSDATKNVGSTVEGAFKSATSHIDSAVKSLGSTVESAVSSISSAVAPEPTEPAIDSRAALNAEPSLPWGVVVTNSFVYAADNPRKAVGTLPGGTVLAISVRKLLGNGTMYLCRYMDNRMWQDKEFLLWEQDIVVFDGVRYSEHDPVQRNAVIDFCIAYGRLEKMRCDEADKRSRGMINPFEAEYRAAKAKHEALVKEIAETKAMWDRTTTEISDPQLRGQLGQKLNQLRVAQKDDDRIYKEISVKWQEWHDRNTVAPDKISATPAMLEQIEIMRKYRDIVDDAVPGLVPAFL